MFIILLHCHKITNVDFNERYSPTDEKESVIYYRRGQNEFISLIQFPRRVIIFIQKLQIYFIYNVYTTLSSIDFHIVILISPKLCIDFFPYIFNSISLV
jgi:hypothetical protein